MPPQFRRNRFRRLLFWILGLLLVGVSWKAFWRFGPGLAGPSALFGLQARVILLANLGPPKRVEASLPAPEKGSSAEAQLRLMELWDGRTWSGKATAAGRVEGRQLRVPAGRIEFVRIAAISPEAVEEGKTICRIDYRVRWNWPDQDRELQRVAAIVGLRAPAPAGFATPGQESGRVLVLERDGWGWRAREPRPGRSEPGGRDRLWSYLAWLF